MLEDIISEGATVAGKVRRTSAYTDLRYEKLSREKAGRGEGMSNLLTLFM